MRYGIHTKAHDELVEVLELARQLHFALRGLYEDQVDYLKLNNLGGMDNHWMRAARIALADYASKIGAKDG